MTDFDLCLEADLIKRLLMFGERFPEVIEIARTNLQQEHFRTDSGWVLYEKYMRVTLGNPPTDFFSLIYTLDVDEHLPFLIKILKNRWVPERAVDCFTETVRKMLERHWLQRREEIKDQIYKGRHSEDEVVELVKEFEKLKVQRPAVQMPRQ